MIRKLLLFLLLGSSAICAEEVVVTVGEDLAGTLSTPSVNPDRAVLMLHGWNGHQHEVGNLYADLAAGLAARGIASLRFNYSGEGERVGYVVTSTFDSRMAESEAALKLLQQKFPGATLGLQGFSLGGLTAMGIVGKFPDTFASMVLWSSAEEMTLSRDSVYEAAVRKAMKEGRAVYRDWTDITLTREFLSGFLGVSTSRHLAGYKGALLTIRGDRDFLPARDPAWLALSPSDNKAFILIGGADHIFNVLDNPKPGYSSRVLEATVDRFDRTL